MKKKILLRLTILLLLLATGTGKTWGQMFYNQDYEDATDASSWNSPNASGSLSLATDGGTGYGKYIKAAIPNDNGRSFSTTFYSTDPYSSITSYTIEFDFRIVKTGTDNNNTAQRSQIAVLADGAAIPSNATTDTGFLFSLQNDNATSKTYYINGTSNSITITTGENAPWYHVLLSVDGANNTVNYNVGGNTGSYTIPSGTSYKAKHIFYEAARYQNEAHFDNIKVYHVGWSESSFTKDITTVNYQNKLDGMPKLYDATGADITGNATFTFPNMVGVDWPNTSYPPRLKSTGSGTVTATVGGNSYSYTLNVTGTNVTGTYDASSNKYTFDQIGVITQRTDVTDLTMEINGGPTALVVNAEGTTALKVIDEGGYSQPNLTNNVVIPWEGNRGGTFYKFTTTTGGTLIIEGNCQGSSLYKSDGTAVLTGFWSTKTFHLDEGTYYLYNPSDVPLLHSYRFISDDKSTLKFKNPNSTIAVDLSEGNYTNEAVSGLGLPITYSILAGGNYATINSKTGKVTFKKSELLNLTFPLTITVMAHTDAWSTYPEAMATYNIQLTKKSWIFDDNDLWATSGSDLSNVWSALTNYAHHYSDGSNHYGLTKKLTDEALTRDGNNELPETKGLRFSTDNSTNRLDIAPHGLSPNYLSLLNSTITIDNVEAGQTVTVDWYATRSSAKITIADAGGNSTGELGQGISTLTATTAGSVTLTFNATTSYIRSIKLSTPIRATGTLTYHKTLLTPSYWDNEHGIQVPAEVENRTGYTIVDEETGADIKSAYYGPGSFKSSNTDVVTVDASGNLTAVATGVAFITATASPKNSATHQPVTMTTMIEVINPYTMNAATTRTRTISVEKLLYEVGENGKSADNGGLDRTVPGFTLTFEGGQGVKCNNEELLTMRNQNGAQGKMNIATRMAEGKAAWIIKVRLTVSNLQNNPQVTWTDYVGSKTEAVTEGVMEMGGFYNPYPSFQVTQGSFDISEIKIYYASTDASTIDNCLNETKVAPNFTFATQHFMRVPGDGRSFQNDKPTSSNPQNFRADEFTYTSSDTRIATIGRDGTGGRLIDSGEATITATFAETDYFAQSTATYTVSNTLLPSEHYDGLVMTTGQFIHVTAKASADNTTLTMENAATNLTYGTTRQRRNSYVSSAASVNLKNETSERITVYSIDIITSDVKAWLYYEGQEENFSGQVQFTGFPTGPIAGFKVVDFGDINNPIDITDAYSFTDGSVFAIEGNALYGPNGEIGGTWYSSGTGDADTAPSGSAQSTSEIRRGLTKTGSADGYGATLTAKSIVTVMQFDADHPVTWYFQNQFDNTGNSGEMGTQWSYNNPGTGREKFYQTYFSSFMPILRNGDVAKENNLGVLVNGDMRYYCGTSGLRLNLTATNAHIKFPVKENMEVVIQIASSAADVNNIIYNTKSVKPPYDVDNLLYIQREGVNSPINAYYLAAENGVVTLDPGDKVGVYIKSIRLQVPELHFEEEIVTELTGNSPHDVNYQPYNAISGHELNYWVKDNWNHGLDDSNLNPGDVATINDAQRHSGDVSLTGNEGWVTIYVEDPYATGVQPKKGEYKLYVVNFHFDPATDAITLDGNGEAVFNRRPVGYDKVKTPIEYTMTLGTGNPRGRIIQYTNENPALTTYAMTAYSTGTITVTATSGNATTSCVVTVNGLSFGYVAPAMSESEVKASNVFTNPLPVGWTASHNYSFQVDRSAYGDTKVECDALPTITTVDGVDVLRLGGLRGYGAIRVIATNTTLNQTARFVLTLSYPASSRKKWSFFRFKDHNSLWGLEIGTIDSYNDYNNKKIAVAKTIDGYNGTASSDTWTTSSTWSQIFRKGAELPRWGNDRSMKGDNAFYVQETAGLQIETGNQGFYVDQPARDPSDKYAYNHIGIHNNASITIPKLKEGDYVALNLNRVIPNNGAILKGYNVTDLRGKNVDLPFTITRSQTEWPSLNSDGSRFIPGYYTFIAHDLRSASDPDKIAHPNEFDVTFELADEGYLDVLSIEIYDGGRYKHTMTEVKLKDQSTLAPNVMLKDENDVRAFELEFCHPLWSTSTGPCRYVFKGLQPGEDAYPDDPTECPYWVDAATTQKLQDNRKNLTLLLEHPTFLSSGGLTYEYGRLTVSQGYGKVVLRMNNYTVEGRYLIGYTPDYVLNVGVNPHQDYPHTWNFAGISNGEVEGLADNVYNSIKNDGANWIKIANVGDVFQLNTDSKGASLYVPGGELVSTDRILGARGETRITGRGFDELNGLGVNGKVLFSINTTAAAARRMDSGQSSMFKGPKRTAGDANDLLTYSMDNANFAATTDLTAGNGTIYFGVNQRVDSNSSGADQITSTKSSCGYSFKCNGGNTKYVLLKPQRAFVAGDVISIKAWSDNENGGLAFWKYRTDVTGTVNLVSLSLTKTNEEDVLEYTVTTDDGIEGLSEIYVYNNGLTTYFNSVTITRSTVPVGMSHNLYTATETILTIPDLNADGKQDWIYISADQEPTAITNATKVYQNNDNDGPDANDNNQVYKYKVTSPGNAYVTFDEGTNIYQIGVTHILKDIHEVGGVGWATESRRHAIDHTLTGYFTVNDANAHTVSYDSYDLNTATVALTRVEENKGVPAKAGVVLKVDDASNLSKANLNTSNNLRRVPLFYPAVSTSVIPYENMRFKADGNMMMANLEQRFMQYERESGVLDDNADNVDDTGADDGAYTRFLLSNIHWTYDSSHTLNADEAGTVKYADAAGFYRMHIWETTGDKDTKNTMPANTAYMLVPTANMPVAVWSQQSGASSRQYTIGIRGLQNPSDADVEGINDLQIANNTPLSSRDGWYSLNGIRLTGEPRKPGIYIFNGHIVKLKKPNSFSH